MIFLCFMRETGKMRIYKICYVFHRFNTTAIQDPLNGQVKGLTSQIGKVYVIFLTKVNKYITLLQLHINGLLNSYVLRHRWWR